MKITMEVTVYTCDRCDIKAYDLGKYTNLPKHWIRREEKYYCESCANSIWWEDETLASKLTGKPIEEI